MLEVGGIVAAFLLSILAGRLPPRLTFVGRVVTVVVTVAIALLILVLLINKEPPSYDQRFFH